MALSLQDLRLVDSPPDEGFDRFTRLATKLLGVPVSLVSIIDTENDRQFFTSAKGLAEPWASRRQTPLSHSFCQHVVCSGKPLIIQDARTVPLVQDNLAIPDLNVIAYLGMPVFGADGGPLGALCAIDGAPRDWSANDIDRLTDLAAAVTDQIGLRCSILLKEEATEAAHRFGRIVENASHEVYTFDAATYRFKDVNKGARDNLGYPAQELLALTPVDINPDFSWAEFDALVQPLKNGDTQSLEFETTHQTRDGRTYPVSIRLEYHGAATEPVFVAFCEDITERRALEQSFQEKSDDFSALFNNAPDPMTISDADATILMANPAYQRLLDCDADALVGKCFTDLIPDEYSAEVIANLFVATPDNPFSSILQRQDLNGRTRFLLWTNATQFAEGVPKKIFSIAKDVTDTHEARLLAEESAAEAKKAIEIRKIFLANMSHEVRTPLNAIMGLFQLIQMADVPARQKKQAEVGLNASHHLLGQLVNVLEISRMEASAVEISPEAIAIRPLADQWLETALATNHRLNKPIEVTLEISEATPETWILDARRVTQIVNNLTDNALKFTREGSVKIEVDIEATSPKQLVISVSDTGCGLDEHQQGVIFERFVQVDAAQTRDNSGSGLGLAINKELADLMGATFKITSPICCYSTTFSLTLPLKTKTRAAPHVIPQKDPVG